MPDWTDKDMEQLFRSAAGQQEFEYKDAAWQQMEQLLDARKRRRRFIFWWWRGLGLLLFVAMLGLGIYHFVGAGREKPGLPAADALTGSAASHLPKESTNEIEHTDLGHETEKLQNTNNHRQAAPSGPALKEEATGSRFGVSARPGIPAPAGHTQADAATGILPPELDNRAKESVVADQKANAASGKVLLPGVLIPYLPMAELPVEFTVPELNPELPALSSQEHELDANKGFYLAVTAAGELTSIGPDDFAQLNSKFGLGLEYRFGSKLGIASGINYMRLDYRAGEGEYIPPKGFWTRKIAPQSTIGHCDILELPLSLNYHGELESGAGVSFSAGLSSLLIFRQRYYYQYDLADDDLIRKWKSNELKSYWLSLGSVSVGYDLPLSAKTRLNIAPYMQFPLTGIGHGNVQLYSAGIAARLGWKL
ncbi:MAG: hypothetical protein CMN32_16470 [Saprospirales bacterium]|nr:hypothetical protein [Saprospirales bacterium]